MDAIPEEKGGEGLGSRAWTPLKPVGRRPLLRRREAAVIAWSSSCNGKGEKGTGRGPRQESQPRAWDSGDTENRDV